MSACADATPGVGIEPVKHVTPDRRPTTLAEWIGELDRQREVALAELDYEALIRGGIQIDALIRDLRTLRDQVVLDAAVLIDVAGDKRGTKTTIDIDGVGRIEVAGSYTHKGWESRRLLSLLVDHALAKYLLTQCPTCGADDPAEDDPGGSRPICRDGWHSDPTIVTGRFEGIAGTLMAELSACLPLGTSLQWRLTELRKRGIDPDDYHEKTENPRKAKLPKVN